MANLDFNGVAYEKIFTLNIGKYEYILLYKNFRVCYVEERNGAYEVPNSDLTLNGNANSPLSILNSRIIMKHVVKIINSDIENKILKNSEEIVNKLGVMQSILQNNEMYSLIKGSVDELNNFDVEVNKMINRFNMLLTECTGVMPKINEEVPEKEKVINNPIIDETAKVDTIMIAMILNIGILLFIMLILNIIR